MMSSLMPSEKYSCSGSPLMLVNGNTAMAGRSRGDKTGRDGRLIPSADGPAMPGAWSPDCCEHTAPTKRKPLRMMVRISL